MDAAKRIEIFHGTWYNIHIYAARAEDDKTKAEFRGYVQMLADGNLPCMECSEHMRTYLQENPLEKELNYFVWSWRFHNAVNKRLGKPEFDFEVARDMYVGRKVVCTDCHAQKQEKMPKLVY